MQALFGASLLSAAASLPLHLLPLLVVAVVADGRLGTAEAAWIASACLLGQMALALLLPAAGLRRLRRGAACAAALALLAGLVLSAQSPAHRLWLPWLAIGGACGVLQFLGATAAAAHPARQAAFALRLSTTLLVSGLVIGGLQWSSSFDGHAALALHLCLLCAALTGCGLLLYRPPELPAPREHRAAGPGGMNPPPLRAAGLCVVFLLFVGQPGFWAFALEGVRQRGVVLEDVALAMAACKVVAALLLLHVAFGRSSAPAGPAQLVWPGIGVAGGIVGMALASGAPQFFAAMLLWELGLNLLSARLQAVVAQDNPASAGSWLTGAALLGAATGPLLHAAAIQVGMSPLFVLYACASALLPFAWASGRERLR